MTPPPTTIQPPSIMSHDTTIPYDDTTVTTTWTRQNVSTIPSNTSTANQGAHDDPPPRYYPFSPPLALPPSRPRPRPRLIMDTTRTTTMRTSTTTRTRMTTTMTMMMRMRTMVAPNEMRKRARDSSESASRVLGMFSLHFYILKFYYLGFINDTTNCHKQHHHYLHLDRDHLDHNNHNHGSTVPPRRDLDNLNLNKDSRCVCVLSPCYVLTSQKPSQTRTHPCCW